MQNEPLSPEPSDRPPLLRGVRGAVCVLLGCFFVGLGVLGAMLPVLPTTPFLLLASFFFVRSSPRLNAKLLNSRLFGPFLRDWHHHRGVRPRVKVTAVVAMLAAVSASLLLGSLPWFGVVGLLVLAAIGLTVVLRLPIIREPVPVEAAQTNTSGDDELHRRQPEAPSLPTSHLISCQPNSSSTLHG